MQSMVEGHAPLGATSRHPLPTNLDNPRNRHGQIVQHYLGRDPQRCNTLRSQEMASRGICLLSTRIVVHPAVNLDRQPRRRTIKVENIAARRMLAAKFQTCGPLAQFAPEHTLRQGHFAAKLARAFYGVGGSGDHSLCPSTTFGGPPPRFGEE